eukprot:Rhum_TRINITY_DN15235_c11_g1::Rhum_TRINITY_DN15235_c11_g1_i1::g.146194::m.146194
MSMALVPAGSEQQYDARSTMSNASAMRGANATEQARRRLKGVMAQKERQCEQMRQTLERKKRLLEEEKREVGALYDAKDADEEAIRRYKEDKLLFRVFKQLDIEKKDSLSIDNIVKRIGGNPDDRLFLDENLFKLLPGSFHFTFRTRQVDKDTLLDVITSNTGVSPLAVEIESGDSHTHGISKITVRLAWHGHPREIAEDPTLPEEENEARRQQVEEYYKSLGGDESSVSEEKARAKEQEMVEAVKTHVPAELGWDVVRVTEDHRATFSDFIENFWAIVSPDMMLEPLRELYAEARQIEEETILPEEALDRVIEMEHMIKSQQKLGAEIARDCALTEKDISNVDKKIDLVSKELAHIQRVTGYDSTQGAQDHVDFALQQEQITQLGSLVKRLEDEHRRGAALLSKRTAEILTLSERVEENSEIEEQVFKATNDLQVVQRECDQLMEQTRVLMMDHSKTDRAIMVLEGSRDVGAVQSLNSDKQYLQGQIEAHKAAKGESDKAIKAQAFRIDVLERRLEVVKAALKDLKTDQKIQRRLKDALTVADTEEKDPYNIEGLMPQEELLDVELYELLNRDLEAITTSMKLKDIILLEKDDTIEATELKLAELAKEKEDDEEYFSHACTKDKKEVENLKDQYRMRQDAQRREREALKKGVATSLKEYMSLKEV